MKWTNRVRATVIGMLLATGGVAQAAYWSLFNIEGESSLSAQYVTYGSLGDMLADSNRLGVFTPNPAGFGVNIVGSGSNGSTYWSLFNIEGESSLSAQYVTYGSHGDMLADSNRLRRRPREGGATVFGGAVVRAGRSLATTKMASPSASGRRLR